MKTDDVYPSRMTEGLCRLLAMGTAAILTLATALPAGETPPATDAAPPQTSASIDATAAPGALWRDTVDLFRATLPAARRLLLGALDPDGPSVFRTDDGPPLVRIVDGGVGTRTVALLADARAERSTARDEFLWQQDVLRTYCDDLLGRNRTVYAKALRLADQAARLAAVLAGATALPEDLRSVGLEADGTQLGWTASQLDAALADGDAAAARMRACEFREAAARLADLHRWVDMLLKNELSALTFQQRCRGIYFRSNQAFDLEKAVADAGLGGYPGAQNAVCLLYNLQAVEHGAEWLFASPGGDGPVPADVPAAAHVPPHLRKAFLRLRDHLGPRTRPLWDEAAAALYHRTYLANVLHRYEAAGVLDQAGLVLERFDEVQTDPTVEALLDVLFYRSGSPSGTRSADERFDARLMQAARTLAGTREQVLLGAQHFTRALFGSWKNYHGQLSLVESLDAGRLDCISASNVIGSVYRNAGRGGLYSVRWCAGTASHSLVGTLVERDGKPVFGVVDGLDRPQTALELWPHAYADGHDWPEGYTGARAPLYAVTLYARGLDSYVWCQGFIVRGEHTGSLVRCRIPYLPAWTPSAYARHGSPRDTVRTRPGAGG